ncbi:adenosylhomocysteinase [Candidatus Saccharibacteria bacterium]|nr:adenosylhomocysteinase [Candidatus Saccharibacteria bacterium]
MSNILDPSLAPMGKEKIEWVKDRMPVLTRIGQELASDKILRGLKIGMSIHLEAKTAYLALILKEAGARVYITGCNPLSTQDDVAAGLASLGVNVYAARGISPDKYLEYQRKVLDNQPDLIIDDGGDLLETYCAMPEAQKWQLYGGCEETTTGIIRLKQREKNGTLPFPMMDINDAHCKHFFDNRFGTGQSVWDGIMHTTNVLVAGKTVVVAGYGYCGEGIAMRAKGLGAKRVIVTEIDPIKAIKASLDGFEVMTMTEAAPLGDYFITATGCKDVITSEHFVLMKDNAFLANSGHFDVEINLHDLAAMSYASEERRENITGYYLENGHTLNVLAEGRLVNLAAGNGHPAEIMDMSFSLQALGLKCLVEKCGMLENKVYNIPQEMDSYVANIKLAAMGIHLDKLTDEQTAYLSF